MRLSRREIEARFRGSAFGMLWAIFIPLLLLAVYTFVFTIVFKTRWELPVTGKGNFALILFAGLILFNIFSECISRAPTLLLSNVTYIKKVVFPLEILPVVTVMSALFNGIISLAVLLVGYVCLVGQPPLVALLVPLAFLPPLLFTIGICWFFSSVGVFVRDLHQVVGVLVMILMFLTPIFYPITAIPAELRVYIQLSPLTVAIEEIRSLLFNGTLPNLTIWASYFMSSWFVAWLGYLWFMQTRRGFADVI